MDEQPVKGWKVLGMGKEFTSTDQIIYLATYAWTLLWTVVFIAGTIFNLTHDVGNGPWMSFWKVYVWVYLALPSSFSSGFPWADSKT